MSKKNKKTKNKKKKRYNKLSDYKSEPRYGMPKNRGILQNVQSLSVMHERTDKILSSKKISKYCTYVMFNKGTVSINLKMLKDFKYHRIKSCRLCLVKRILKPKENKNGWIKRKDF